MAERRVPANLQLWIDARKRHRLSHAQVQMARELGFEPKSLAKIDNHHDSRWKASLPEYIEDLYERRFGRERPERVLSIEERVDLDARKKAAKREAKALRRAAEAGGGEPPPETGQEGS